MLRQALAHQRGVVYVTGHLGPWERMAALLAAEGFPISTMARESYDRRFHALVYERLRNNRNIETIYRGSPGAPFAMVRALRRGRVLGFFGRPPRANSDPPRRPLGPPLAPPAGTGAHCLESRMPARRGYPLTGSFGARGLDSAAPKSQSAPRRRRGTGARPQDGRRAHRPHSGSSGAVAMDAPLRRTSESTGTKA